MTRFMLPTIVALLLIVNTSLFAGGGHEHEGSHGSEKHEDSHAHGTEKAGLRSITGEVVDLSCYLDHKAKGPGHKKCAITCAKKGLPMGILTEDNELYLFVEDHSNVDIYKKAIDHAAETITVKGMIYDAGGVRAIQLKEME